MLSKPLLYSFRRCPYAIRARLAIAISGVNVDLCEVDLRAKPARMLRLSAKATVPILELPNGSVIDESLDIMLWVLRQNDPFSMLPDFSAEARALVERNDSEFKYALDRYKYPERHPEFSMQHYRKQCEIFLSELSVYLDKNKYFFGDAASVADLALAPFIRQFASVDRNWFNSSRYVALRGWLDSLVASNAFIQAMQKY